MDISGKGKPCLYRYEEVRYSLGVDEWDEPLPGYTLKLHLREYEIISETPKGAWIVFPWYMRQEDNDKKFVLLTARKKFACRTKDEAIESFIARKNKQIKIVNAQLKQARLAIDLAKSLKGETPDKLTSMFHEFNAAQETE